MLKVLQLIGAPGSGKTFLMPTHLDRPPFKVVVNTTAREVYKEVSKKKPFFSWLIEAVSKVNKEPGNYIDWPHIVVIDDCRPEYATAILKEVIKDKGEHSEYFTDLFLFFCLEEPMDAKWLAETLADPIFA